MNTTRNILISVLGLAAASYVAGLHASTSTQKDTMKYELRQLDYPKNALEPAIDAETVTLHHDKHQATYVDKLNAALATEPSFDFKGSVGDLISNLSAVPESIRNAVRNNGGGVWNHEFYWRSFSPDKSHPSPELLAAIKEAFGSFENFQKQLSAAAVNQFGSGWAWLGVGTDGKLKIASTPNQDAPIMGSEISKTSMIPILNIDVWEHAYYVKYRNRRAEYVEAVWNIIDWNRVSARYEEAVKNKKVSL